MHKFVTALFHLSILRHRRHCQFNIIIITIIIAIIIIIIIIIISGGTTCATQLV